MEFTKSLAHHGILGQKWGIRRFQNKDGSLTDAGKKRYSGESVFVSGSSKTQTEDSGFYRKKLPKEIRKELNGYMKKGDKIIVGDAPGIDRQVQDYLNKKNYSDVEVYGPGKEVRYKANKKWTDHPVDDPEHEPGSPEWLRKKDEAMTNAATKGLAIVIENGAQATRNNIDRLKEQGKDVSIYELKKDKKFDGYVDETGKALKKISEQSGYWWWGTSWHTSAYSRLWRSGALR